LNPGRRFVKSVPLADVAMLDAEAEGLRALGACGAIVVPVVIEQGTREGKAFLATSWLDFGDTPRGEAMGRALARLHRAAQGPRYGWARDNFIGRTPQVNGWNDDWIAFFRERRLRPQFERAARYELRDTDALLDAVPRLLRGHTPPPSLLHGDLWSGNAAMLASGEPAIFDPAVYYGDREADIAMTHLFGGFDASFYSGYEDEWPLPPGQQLRRDLYNLYHIVNHLNLFGGSYRAQAQATIARLLRHE
jgi:protein-ribulosamine 3-kinase